MKVGLLKMVNKRGHEREDIHIFSDDGVAICQFASPKEAEKVAYELLRFAAKLRAKRT